MVSFKHSPYIVRIAIILVCKTLVSILQLGGREWSGDINQTEKLAE